METENSLKIQNGALLSDGKSKADSVEGFTYIVVAGVIQKIPSDRPAGQLPTEPQPIRFRSLSPLTHTKPDRRISCKDLGKGECEGWLYKRKQRGKILSRDWDKRWCVLKNCNFYYYKSTEDLQAQGIIHLPAFQVSPAPEFMTKKFAFRIHNSGTMFHFASDRQADMSKWMNKIGLAAISYEASQKHTTGGVVISEQTHSLFSTGDDNGYSESENEEEANTQPMLSNMEDNCLSSPSNSYTSSPQVSPLLPRQPITYSPEAIGQHQGDNGVLSNTWQGSDSQDSTHNETQKHHSPNYRTNYKKGNPIDLDKLRKLNALKSSLQVKEQELQEIEYILCQPVSFMQLVEFVDKNNLKQIVQIKY